MTERPLTFKQNTPWAKLPALAKRLGVKPIKDKSEFIEVSLIISEGERYDLLDLVNALLDRIDLALDKDSAK